MNTALHTKRPLQIIWPAAQRRNERDETRRARRPRLWVRSTPPARRWPGVLTALAVAFIVGGAALFGQLPL
jgi:hypothetical protein